MSSYADLHIHTNCSDGSDSPARVVERAAEQGLAAIAVTDHDTVGGIKEAETAARIYRVELLRGTEISASFGRAEVHVVGLGVDPEYEPLLEALRLLREARSLRLDKIIERLTDVGAPLERAEVEAQATSAGALGRIHIARALKARGIVSSVQQGFDRYIGRDKKAFVPKKTMPCATAIDLIHQAGGVAILAHPGVGSSVQRMLTKLLKLPFDGIEVYHTKHTPGQVTQFTHIALEQDLLISGGSDCHGTAAGDHPDMGRVRLPYYHVESIKQALCRGGGTSGSRRR